MPCCNCCKTSSEKHYNELSLHSLSKRRWGNKLFFLYKILNGFFPKYLYWYLTLPSQENYTFRSASTSKTNLSLQEQNLLKRPFFPYCINEWNSLNDDVRNAKSIHIFKKIILFEKKKYSLFFTYDPLGVKLLTRLRLQSSHLNEHKFRHGFGDTVRAMCGCNVEIEDTDLFLLLCHFYSIQRFKLFNNINKADPSFTQLDTKEQVNILLYRYRTNKSNALNQDIIKFVINFLRKSCCFDKPLISFNNDFMCCFYSSGLYDCFML